MIADKVPADQRTVAFNLEFRVSRNPDADALEALWMEVTRARELLTDRYHPDAFNIGVNDGEAAGQTINYAHIHIIPRNRGDVPDPRGGIRRVIPGKAKYW